MKPATRAKVNAALKCFFSGIDAPVDDPTVEMREHLAKAEKLRRSKDKAPRKSSERKT
jgi:hypothetical protein